MKSKKYAGFPARTNALSIDIIIGILIYSIIYFVYINKLPLFAAPDAVTASFWGISVFFMAFNVLFKGSPGYKIFGLKVRNAKTGDEASALRMFFRSIAFVFSWFSLFIGFFSSLFRKNRMALHDCMAGTIVTYKDYEYDPDTAVQKPTPFNAVINLSSLLIAIFVIYHVYLLYFDEPMTEFAKTLVENDYHETNPEENGFYYIVGFTADPEEDQFMAGREFVDIVNRNAIENKVNNDVKPPVLKKEFQMFNLEEAENIGIVGSEDKEKNRLTLENADRIRELSSKYAFMDEQISKILSKDVFVSTIIPDPMSAAPHRMNYVNYYRLKSSSALLEYLEGNYDKAVAIVKKNDSDLRFLLENSPSLAYKLIFQICSVINLSSYSSMETYKMTDELHKAVHSTENYTAKQKSLSEVLKDEARYFRNHASGLKYLSKDGGMRKFFALLVINTINKDNYLTNRKNDFYKRAIKLSETDENEFYNMIKQPQDSIRFSYTEYFRYFIIEEELITQGYMFDRYAAKVQGLNGFLNLIKAKADVLKNKPEDVQVYLNESDIKNPFTGEPIEWDAETKTLKYNLKDFDMSIEYLTELKL